MSDKEESCEILAWISKTLNFFFLNSNVMLLSVMKLSIQLAIENEMSFCHSMWISLLLTILSNASKMSNNRIKVTKLSKSHIMHIWLSSRLMIVSVDLFLRAFICCLRKRLCFFAIFWMSRAVAALMIFLRMLRRAIDLHVLRMLYLFLFDFFSITVQAILKIAK
jgi:hypothetical protein